jgi:hypothetical protein
MVSMRDIDAGVLELQVYDGEMPGGVPVELAISLLDLENDALMLSSTVRERGAQAYGMLFFKSISPRCPKQGVVWERFDDDLQVTAAANEAYLLDRWFHALCIQMVAMFLADIAGKDARYAWLAPSRPA